MQKMIAESEHATTRPSGERNDSRIGRAPQRFRPSPQQVAYLGVWVDPDGPKSITAICRHLNLPRRTVYHWLESAAFVKWFEAELHRHTHHLWHPVLLTVARLAGEGSVEHARMFFKICGGLNRTNNDEPGGFTITIGMPRPASARSDYQGGEVPGASNATIEPLHVVGLRRN